MRLNGLGRDLVEAAARARLLRGNATGEGVVLLAKELDYHLARACLRWVELHGAGTEEMLAEVQSVVEEIGRRGSKG